MQNNEIFLRERGESEFGHLPARAGTKFQLGKCGKVWKTMCCENGNGKRRWAAFNLFRFAQNDGD